MNLGSATELARVFIYTQLAARSGILASPVGLNIHPWPVPEDMPYPFITSIKRGAPVVSGPIGGRATATTLRYEIKAVDQGYDNARILDAASEIFEAFDGVEIYLDGGFTIYSQLESDLLTDLPLDGGDAYTQLGGIYELMITEGA